MSVILLNYKLKVVKIIACYQVGKTTWYHCTTCGRRFYSAPSIMSHIYATHNKDLTTVTMCEKEFTDY